MKRLIVLWLAAVCLAAGGASGASAAGDATVAELEILVERWVALRGEVAAERRAFAAGQEHRQDELALLDRRRQALTRAVDEAREAARATGDRQRELETRAAALRETLEDLRAQAGGAEAELRRWAAVVPLPLRDASREAFAALMPDDTRAAALPLARRLQAVAALYTLIESLQHDIHVVREVLPAGDTRREADVVYLGLARAFAVTRDDAWAAVGEPGPAGWSWTPRPELAPDVRRAVLVAGRELPAALVNLPLRVAALPDGSAVDAPGEGGASAPTPPVAPPVVPPVAPAVAPPVAPPVVPPVAPASVPSAGEQP